jgi:hypothetical protein
VCLQVIERLDTVRVNRQGIPIEVALTQDMHHLGVARCLAWGISQPDPELAKLSPAAATPTCWMVQEYCDKHTLVVSHTHTQQLNALTATDTDTPDLLRC